MTAARCARTLRAAVFAVVCVTLASLAHVMTAGTPLPRWAIAAGAMATGGTAWPLAGRKRRPVAVGSLAVAAQVVLHASFSLAQAAVRPRPPGGGTAGDAPAAPMTSMDHVWDATHPTRPADTPPAGAGPMSAAVMDAGATDAGVAPVAVHGTGGTSSAGMFAAHLLAALLCGLWLAHGERAVSRVLRALAGWLVAPLRLVLRQPAPPHRPRVRARRGGAERAPRQSLLACANTSRGPPGGTAVA